MLYVLYCVQINLLRIMSMMLFADGCASVLSPFINNLLLIHRLIYLVLKTYIPNKSHFLEAYSF